MTILLAPDKFKGSLSAREVCDAMARGIARYDPEIQTIAHPLADGGDGTLEVLRSHLNLETVRVAVKNPLFREIEAAYLKNSDTAFIEMAKASGLELLAAEERNCLHTTTYGTGQMILHAVKNGIRKVYLFIGGSATNDAGMGMASALGFHFLDSASAELLPVGENLIKLSKIESKKAEQVLSDIEFFVVSDVNNPLFGPNGAAFVYGPQKGADSQAVNLLDRGLRNFSEIAEKTFDKEIADVDGAGAAGGLGAGAMVFLGAKMINGTQMVLETTGFEKNLEKASHILTGEGKLDLQTTHGKVIDGVARMARKYNLPVFVICGTSDLPARKWKKMGIQMVFPIRNKVKSTAEAMNKAADLVEEAAFEWIKDLLQSL